MALDSAGNASPHSNIVSFVLSDGKPRISFTFEDDDYGAGAVSPRKGTSGKYIFKVRYTELEGLEPKTAQVWVDLDGDGKYSFLEKYNLFETRLTIDRELAHELEAEAEERAAREAVEKAEREARERREAIEKVIREAAEAAERKAERDRRYAARKARQTVKR